MHNLRPICIALICLMAAVASYAQMTGRVHQYSIGLQVDAGQSFPSFTVKQSRWKAGFYGTGAASVLLHRRLRQHWEVHGGVGITAYTLSNRGPRDAYVLDFASPHAVAGIQYLFNGKRGIGFVGISSGAQLGYGREFTEHFEGYRVHVQGNGPIIAFVRPSLGMRKRFKSKHHGRYYYYELGGFFRHNFQRLGTATFVELDYTIVANPRGNMIGLYAQLLIPTGRKKVKLSSKAKPAPRPISETGEE